MTKDLRLCKWRHDARRPVLVNHCSIGVSSVEPKDGRRMVAWSASVFWEWIWKVKNKSKSEFEEQKIKIKVNLKGKKSKSEFEKLKKSKSDLQGKRNLQVTRMPGSKQGPVRLTIVPPLNYYIIIIIIIIFTFIIFIIPSSHPTCSHSPEQRPGEGWLQSGPWTTLQCFQSWLDTYLMQTPGKIFSSILNMWRPGNPLAIPV